MTEFQLDTSGVVILTKWTARHNGKTGWEAVSDTGEVWPDGRATLERLARDMAGCRNRVAWSDLSPFTQGYIEALFASETDEFGDMETSDGSFDREVHFSDLAPETLARIIADCEAQGVWLGVYGTAAEDGANFWKERQDETWVRFPPLTVQLCDDGKVRFAPDVPSEADDVNPDGVPFYVDRVEPGQFYAFALHADGETDGDNSIGPYSSKAEAFGAAMAPGGFKS